MECGRVGRPGRTSKDHGRVERGLIWKSTNEGLDIQDSVTLVIFNHI